MKHKLENGDLVKTSNLGDLYFVCENDDFCCTGRFKWSYLQRSSRRVLVGKIAMMEILKRE